MEKGQFAQQGGEVEAQNEVQVEVEGGAEGEGEGENDIRLLRITSRVGCKWT